MPADYDSATETDLDQPGPDLGLLDPDSSAPESHPSSVRAASNHPALDSSDDDIPMADPPRFIKGSATHGDAEAFCRKAARLLRSGKYSTYSLKAQVSQLSQYCDDTTASKLDALLLGTGVDGIPWIPQLGIPEVLADDGVAAQAAVPPIDGATLHHVFTWFINKFSKQDVIKAAKKRLQSSHGQTTHLDQHLDQMERDIATVGGTLTDNSQVDNILASISPSCVDELVGYKGLGAKARDINENPSTNHVFNTGEMTITWLLNEERAYITAAESAGASQYWIGFKDRKLQTHPKRAKGVHAVTIEESSRIKQLENRQDKFEAQILDVQQSQLETKQEIATLSTTVTTWHADSDKKQDEMLTMLRKGSGRKGKGYHGGKGAWQQQGYGGNNREQATMYGRSGGAPYGKGTYGQTWSYNRQNQQAKGGQGNPGRGDGQPTQPWMSKPRQTPAHIECWNCGKNHFAYQCTEPPNARDPEVQKTVNAIDDSLRGTGQYSTQDITEQFETLESATSYIAHVRKATEEMVRVDHSECDVTNAWPAPQVQIAAVQQQQSQYSNINATSDGASLACQRHELTETSQVGTMKATGATMAPAGTELAAGTTTQPAESSAGTLFWQQRQQNPHFLRTTFTDSDPIAIEGKWARVFADRSKKWRNRRRRRGAERKNRERKKIASDEKEAISRITAALLDSQKQKAESELAWKVVNHRPHYMRQGKINSTDRQPSVCGLLEGSAVSEPGTAIRHSYKPHLQKPSGKTTAAYCLLLLLSFTMSLAFSTAVTDPGSTQSAIVTGLLACVATALLLGCRDNSMRYTEMMFPPLISLITVALRGSSGLGADSVVRHLASSSAQHFTNTCGSFGGMCTNVTDQILRGAMRHVSYYQWMRLASISFVFMAFIWQHSGTVQTLRAQRRKTKLIAAQAAEQEKQFNSAFIEIELVDEPGRIIRVLVDLGASCSVFSKRALRGVFHQLIMHPPKAKLIAANGGSLGLALGIARLRFRFKGHDKVYEHNVEVVDNDGVPCILGVDWWKSIGAQISLNPDNRGDTVSWTTSTGELITLPIHCTAPCKDLQSMSYIADGLVLNPSGSTGDSAVVKAYLDCSMDEIRQNQKLMWSPSLVTCEANNSIYGTDDRDLAPAPTSHTSYMVNPQIEREGSGALRAYVNVLLVNQSSSDMVLPPGARVGTVAAYDTQQGDTINRVSKEEYQSEVLHNLPAKHRIWTHMFKMADGVWRACAILDVLGDGAHELLFMRGAKLSHFTASVAATQLNLRLVDGNLVDRTAIGQPLQPLSAEGVRQQPRNEATRFRPKLKLPEKDWRQQLNHEPTALLRDIWLHESKQDYKAFLKTFQASLKFGEDLTEEQKEQVRLLLFAYRKIIALDPKAPKPMDGVECRLHFKSSRPTPFAQPLRRLSPADKEIHHSMSDKMLKNEVIEYADSEWAAGVVLAKKKGTTEKRYAVDLRGLNLEILGCAMGVPRIDELLDAWGKASWFSTWDNAAAFWSIPIREEDKKYFAYYAWYQGRYQQFQFRVMPYGLKTASSIYQTAYSKVMAGLDNCTVYIDDAVQATIKDDFSCHLQDLTRAFTRLEANSMYIKLPKCIWGTKTLPVLGHLVKAKQGVCPDPEKVAALLAMDKPSTVGLLKSLLGSAGYLSKFIPDYAALVEPLREMDGNGRNAQFNIEAEWNPRRVKAFEGVKAAMCSAPVLASPDFSKPWIILTDCSGTTMGAALVQKDENGIERPVAYASCTLSEAQKNYSISESEGLAVCWAVRKWRCFLHSSDSAAIVVTDHSCLKNLTSSKTFENRRLNRYAVELSEHNLKIIYRKGADHHLPDLLSRMSRVTPCSVEAKRLGDEAAGCTAPLLFNSKCNVGTAANRYSDSDIFSPGSAQRRITAAVSALERQEGRTTEEIFSEMVGSKHTENSRSGDEHEAALWDFYDLVATTSAAEHDSDYESDDEDLEPSPAASEIGPLSINGIREAQQDDRFSKQMAAHLQSACQSIPADEMEAMKILTAAPFFIMQDNLLYRLEKPRSFKQDKLTRIALTGDLQRLLYIPEGIRGQIIRLVHNELGHAGELRTFQAIRARFYWPVMHTDVCTYIKRCGTCQLHAKRAPKAPIQGHLRASRSGEIVAMDVLHLAAGEGDDGDQGLVLCCIDAFSRYAIVTPIADTKSLTIATALRDEVLKHGWGRPSKFVIDGASYFKAEVGAGITAWNAIMRTSAPHHAESHGIVEKFNQTYARTLKTFQSDPSKWRSNYAAANEAYNRSVHRALSAAGMPLTPIEVWRPGHTVSPYTVPETEVADSIPKDYQQHYKEQLRLHANINKCVELALTAYNDEMVNQPSNKRRENQLRSFKLNDTVTRHKASGNKTIDKLSALQQGPYKIIHVDDTGVDYTIQRMGSTEPAVRVHIDEIKAYKVFAPAAAPEIDAESDYESDDDELAPAKPHSKRYEVDRIMAERKLSPRQGGGIQYLISWKPLAGKSFACSWEPADNLECPMAIQSWSTQQLADRSLLLKEAKRIGINAVSQQMPFSRQLSEMETILLMDLSLSQKGRMVFDVCKRLNIDPDTVLLVWASPPCDSYSKLGPVNAGRGTHTRDYSDPTWPPRRDGSKQGQRAQNADRLTENLSHSLLAARKHGMHFAQENPTGGLSRRPFMHNPDWLQHTQCLTVDYCAYDHPVKKPTNIWISEFAWVPSGTTGNGRCNNACNSGHKSASTGRYVHDAVLAGRGDRSLSPPHIAQQKNSVPRLLQEEIITAALSASADSASGVARNVVIDLFAGYGSLRTVVKEHGLQYVAVDIKDFMK